jgi:hypothetical protein
MIEEAQTIWTQISRATKLKWKIGDLKDGVASGSPFLSFAVHVQPNVITEEPVINWMVTVFLDPTDTYTVTMTGVSNNEVVYRNSVGDIYCDNLSDVIDMLCGYAPTKFTKTMIVEVNANEFWDNEDNINFRFCKEHCRASDKIGAMFIMDGTSYSEKLDDAKEYGCDKEFIAAYEAAMNLGGEFVMFYHDV